MNSRESEIVIVDDNSDSDTKRAISEATNLPTVTSVSHASGPSRRENLAASFERARHPIVCYMDIDLATDLAYLPALTDALHCGAAIAIGSRYSGVKPQREIYRLLVSKVYNLVLWAVFGTRVADHNCGFKAFRKEVIVGLVERLGYDRTGRRGWFWDAEMLIRAQREGLRISEIPVVWSADQESTFSVRRKMYFVLHAWSFWRETRGGHGWDS